MGFFLGFVLIRSQAHAYISLTKEELEAAIAMVLKIDPRTLSQDEQSICGYFYYCMAG
jgi:hypothetical protein